MQRVSDTKITIINCFAEISRLGAWNPLEQEEDTQRNYLWALRDLLAEADQLNEKQIAEGMRYLKRSGENASNA